MHFQKTFILILLLFLLGCSDYPEGYRDGVNNIEKREWVIFGKSEYFDGYSSGQAESFQQDWLLENPIGEWEMYCPTNVVRTDILTFLPAEYSKIENDIYSH